jgi:1-piperideine-2-carboxylate/1-pyrroline-2-carboxylate reductase [NAD(P)H]
VTLLLDPHQTAARLPYPALAAEVARLLADASVVVPPRLVQTLPGGGSLFVMPALDARLAITKLITFTPANIGGVLPTIQGDVTVFDIATGERRLILDGPTVTARRTAAVSLLAAQCLVRNAAGPLLIVGAGAQGRAHLEAFAQGLGVREVRVASRSAASAQRLVDHARTLGLRASVVTDVDAQVAHCPLVVTCTPASGVVLNSWPRPDAFVAAVGAFTPAMVELDANLCRRFAAEGTVIVDTPDAGHEAGDLLQAGLDGARFADLRAVVLQHSAAGAALAAAPARRPARAAGPILFKSCGWAGWDLAAARTAIHSLETT